MSCPHASDPSLRPPRPSQSVYREDCTLCFDSIDDPSGLDVCLHCFNGGCAGERNHSKLHNISTQHPLVVNIKRTRKPVKRDEPPPKMTKLSIAAETEEDKYDTVTQVKCYACGLDNVDTIQEALKRAVDGVLNAATFARQEEVKAWEQELTPCEHTLCLKQQPSRQIASQDLGQCSRCDLKENLWLCLECGNLGCGRAQLGGVGGNSHGLAHATDTQHPVTVKLGSITPEGSADVYCYSCDEERTDTELVKHLANWGIDIADRVKTEKSLTELQIEQNLRWDFAMVSEDGKELQPLYGSGFTGLRNLGNSCYLASSVQCLFSLPEFQQRYLCPNDQAPPAPFPAEDLETQMRKLADGLLSGRYSHPDRTALTEFDSPEASHQRGLGPAMFKSVIGKGHEEFSTMRQNDAFEFLQHMIKRIRISNSSNSTDPTSSFKFVMEQRLQCLTCKRVRYSNLEHDGISVPVPAREKQTANGNTNGDAPNSPTYEAVTLKECLDIYTAPTEVTYSCTACGSKDFTKSIKFKTFPQTLLINPLRFSIVNWVPTKLDIPVEVPDDAFDMQSYQSTGLQPGEEELPDDGDVFVPNPAAHAQLQEMGFPAERCEKALRLTGNSDVEAAMQWLFTHMDDDGGGDEDVAEAPKTAGDAYSEQIETLAQMGISAPQARKGLRMCNGDVERAVDWVFSHLDDPGDAEETGSVASTCAVPKPEVRGSTDESSFELQSIICHKGTSVHAGHYVVFVRKVIPGSGKEKQWVLFNDEKVVKAVDAEEMKQTAYVFIFRRL
ncbi:hypothetical protein DV736_g394, partial [Chaetothyriales sp. CBS 134916]